MSRSLCRWLLASCPSGRRVKSVRLVPSWAGGRWAFGWRTVLPGVETARGWGEAGPSAAVETCGGSLRLGRLEATAQDLEGLSGDEPHTVGGEHGRAPRERFLAR